MSEELGDESVQTGAALRIYGLGQNPGVPDRLGAAPGQSICLPVETHIVRGQVYGTYIVEPAGLSTQTSVNDDKAVVIGKIRPVGVGLGQGDGVLHQLHPLGADLFRGAPVPVDKRGNGQPVCVSPSGEDRVVDLDHPL